MSFSSFFERKKNDARCHAIRHKIINMHNVPNRGKHNEDEGSMSSVLEYFGAELRHQIFHVYINWWLYMCVYVLHITNIQIRLYACKPIDSNEHQTQNQIINKQNASIHLSSFIRLVVDSLSQHNKHTNIFFALFGVLLYSVCYYYFVVYFILWRYINDKRFTWNYFILRALFILHFRFFVIENNSFH